MTGRRPAEGEALPPFGVTPTLGDAVRYCGLIWTFPAVFFDAQAAKAGGMPGTIVPGPLKLGHIYRAVDRWLAGRGFVRDVRAANRRPDLTGRPLTIRGAVTRMYADDGHDRADLEVVIEDTHGEVTVRAFVVVEWFASTTVTGQRATAEGPHQPAGPPGPNLGGVER